MQYTKNVAQIKGAFYIDALVVVIFSGGPLTYLPLIAVKCKHSWVWWGGGEAAAGWAAHVNQTEPDQ